MGDGNEQVLVFSKDFSHHSYGPHHPLKVERLQLTMDLIDAYGLFETSHAPWIEARKAEEQDLLLVHSPEYLQVLKKANEGKAPPEGWKYGLGSGDNPVFPGLYDWSLLVTGATIECVRQIREENRKIAFNIGGGLHHAMKSRAAGFCYLNDPAVAIAKMVESKQHSMILIKYSLYLSTNMATLYSLALDFRMRWDREKGEVIRSTCH